MIKRIITKILYPRHFWREASFDELSEIYASMFLRSLSVNIIAIFVPIYLYKVGYSISEILLLWGCAWFLLRPAYTFVAGVVVSKFGPKHTMILANVAQILYLVSLLTIQDLHWPLPIVATIGSFATGLFKIAFQVDFSKVKHSEHGGQELGYEQIFERIGAVVGPLAGGLIASFIDPRYTIALAIAVLFGSLIPIFMSAEPTKINQPLRINGFPWRRHKWDFISGAAFDVETIVSAVFWPIFISVTIITTNTYALLGVLSALSTGIALLTIYGVGKMVDDRRGGMLLRFGAIANGLLHLFRPFVISLPQILLVNSVNEPVTATYRIPYFKGRYDAADSEPGYRVAYFCIQDIMLSIFGGLLYFTVWALSEVLDPIMALKISFAIGAVASFLIMTQRFAALQDRKVEYSYAKASIIRFMASNK